MLSFINPYLSAIKSGAIVAAVVACFWAGWHVKGLEEEKAIAQAEAHAVNVTQAQDKITESADVAAALAQQQVQTITTTIIKKVPIYVSKKADAACAVPLGFVRLHDASAAGVQPVPDPAGRSNDAPSGVGLAGVAGTVASNYGKYHEVVEQLRALQAWVRAQQGLKR